MTTSTQTPLSSPVFGRFKQAVRRAVGQCGGVDGAGATARRSRTTAGEWNARQHPALPPLDCGFALDEAAVIAGQRPEIVHAWAAELGGVFIQLPDLACGDDALGEALAEATAEFGDVARRIVEARRDGVTTAAEREAVVAEAQEATEALQRIVLIARGGEVVPLGSRGGAEARREAK